jgi:hypothetical protein
VHVFANDCSNAYEIFLIIPKAGGRNVMLALLRDVRIGVRFPVGTPVFRHHVLTDTPVKQQILGSLSPNVNRPKRDAARHNMSR